MGHLLRTLIVIITLGLAGQTAFATSPNANALFNQGKAYHDGIGVAQDFEAARAYYERAANAGSTDAQLNLGYLYFVGEGVERDFAAARAWYEKAAQAGDKSAAQNLAFMDSEGLGLPVKPQAKTTPVIKERLVALPKPAAIARNIYVPNSPLLPAATRNYDSLVDIAPPAATTSTPVTPITATPITATPIVVPTEAKTGFSAFTVFGGITALALAIAAALGWFADYQAAKTRRATRALAQQFFEHNRRLLREIYIRYPSEMRDMGKRESGWAVAISVLIVRFVIFKKTQGGDNDMPKAISDAILSAVKTNPAKSRHLAYRLAPDILTLIQSDIRAFDKEHETQPEAPPIYKSPRVNPRKLVWEPRIVSST